MQSHLETNFRGLRACIAADQAAGFGKFSVEHVEAFQDDEPLAGRVTIQARDIFEARGARQHGKHGQEPICAYAAGVLIALSMFWPGETISFVWSEPVRPKGKKFVASSYSRLGLVKINGRCYHFVGCNTGGSS